MKTCGECGAFCSCGVLWPAGLCLPGGDRLIEATSQACVLWEKDWRGVDQSDGVAERTAEDEGAGGETSDGVHDEGALGVADPHAAEYVRKPVVMCAGWIPPRTRFKQPQLF